MGEQRIASERKYDGRVVKLDVDRVRLDDGRESVREVIRHPGAVLIVPVFDDGRVLMIRQHRYAPGCDLLELPAGTLDHAGESLVDAARRELAEETGYSAREWRLLTSFYTTPGFTDELIHCFLATGLAEDAAGEPDADEQIEPVVLPLAEARAMARRGEIRDAKTMVGLFCAP